MSESPRPQIAIVGSGPSGSYVAGALRRRLPLAEIVIFDRLCTPFGLVRYGVAPDHQHTKTITRQFERMYLEGGVRFAGNIEIGQDVTLDQLRSAFHVVVLATGLDADRPLSIPGADLPGVLRAGPLTRAFNSHPDEPAALPEFGDHAVVIGAGNVAIDIARLLLKTSADFHGSDVDDAMLDGYLRNPVRSIDVVSRSPLVDAKADAAMLRELGTIGGVNFSASSDHESGDDASPEARRRIAAVDELIARPKDDDARVDVHFSFGATPVSINGDDRVRSVTFRDSHGRSFEIIASSVISAIGFVPRADALGTGLSFETATGRLAEGLYGTGWFHRGAVGAIPENRADALRVVDELVADLGERSLPLRAGYSALPADVRENAVDYSDWLRLDTVERTGVSESRIRKKIRDRATITSLVRASSSHDLESSINTEECS
ncbi:MAG TPA: hypothetical protein DEA59_11950 [Microbacterium sp.]|nr:hypothetical protein [Microbacterium sp.]HBR89957.1 hypothetical protein [Microbacterium sp.]